MSSLNTDCIAHQAENIYYLSFHVNTLHALVLKEHIPDFPLAISTWMSLETCIFYVVFFNVLIFL